MTDNSVENPSDGLSIICCSVDSARAEKLERNIALTIGRPYEFIAFDNRECGYGLAKVYNLCAERATCDNLCFIHEDVSFDTDGWGATIIDALHRPQCGAIGFAGGTLRMKGQLTMFIGRADRRTHFCRGDQKRIHARNPERLLFSPVVTLDGMALFVTKALWQEVRFDELTCPRFHGYDADFTIAATAKGYCNAVCNTVLVRHYSDGKFVGEWFDTMRRIADKWDGALPLSTEPLTTRKIRRRTVEAEAATMRIAVSKRAFDRIDCRKIIAFLRRNPLCPKGWGVLFRYLLAHKRPKR